MTLDLMIDKILKLFDTLCKEFNLPATDIYNYMRIAHFLNSSNLPPMTITTELIYNFLTHLSYPKRVIASFYKVLSNHQPYTQVTSLTKWMQELNLPGGMKRYNYFA